MTVGETQGSSRPRIPAKTRAEVKKLLIAGRPAPRSPPPPGISLPGIQVVKKFLGLVKARR